MRFIETLREGERVNDIYLCKFKQSAVTKTGKPYENLILQDKTGSIDGKVWDPNSAGIEDFDALDYVQIGGEVTSFAGTLQLNIKRARKISEGEYDPADYLPVSARNIDEMYDELKGFIGQIENPYLHRLVTDVFVEDEKFAKAFRTHSAAKSVHHGFVGGLLEHTLGVVNLCAHYAKTYPILSSDLLLSAAMLHDIGKVYELSDFPVNDYTDEGQLLGHIVIGAEIVGEHIRRIPDFPPVLAAELKHCLLSHHGELEFGSPKKPAIAEALALHFADAMDAKMETLKEMFRSSGDKAKWLGYSRWFESNIRKTDV